MEDANKLIHQTLELRRFLSDTRLPEVIFMGPVNSGKSTLINGLLRSDICPVDASPCTFVPIRLSAGSTFYAEAYVKGKSRKVVEKRQLADFVRKKAPVKALDYIEIRHTADILNWCSLVDTPGAGVNPESDRVLDKLAAGSPAEIIFLLHQRGMDSSTYKYLNGIRKTILSGNINISFWINVNTGFSDGTPLPETGTALRQLFPGHSSVHLINTRDNKSIDLLSLYLKTAMAGRMLRQIEKQLQRMDRNLPGRLGKIAGIKNDGEFLRQFWDLYQDARGLLLVREAVSALPGVGGRIHSLFKDNSNRLVLSAGPSAAARELHGNFSVRPLKIEQLIEEMARDSILNKIIPPAGLRSLAEKIKNRKYMIEVVGTFSSGKTTFLNALLGENILPTGDKATTACTVVIGYDSEKKAVVRSLLQPVFNPVRKKEGKYVLDRKELKSLQSLINDEKFFSEVADVEIAVERDFYRIAKYKLAGVLEDTISQLSKEKGAGSANKIASLIPKFLSKQMPSRENPPPTAVRLTLKNPLHSVFNLDNPEQKEQFVSITSPPYSYIIENVEVFHPSMPLREAYLIDNPGWDSPDNPRVVKKPVLLRRADIRLYFLHGKHLASNVREPPESNTVENNPPEVYYVINFADTMNQLEREKASLFVRLKLPILSGKQPLPYPRVYMISALEALQGRDEGYNRLVRQLTRSAADQHQQLLRETEEKLRNMLGEALERYSSETLRNKDSRNAITIKKYLDELKFVSRMSNKPGGNKAWKTPGC